MAYAKISVAAATTINLARNHASDTDRKAVKKELFAAVKEAFGIPQAVKVKAETSNTASPDYLVLKRQDNGQPFELDADGKWTGADPAPQRPNPTRWFFVDDDQIKEIALDTQSWDDGYTEPDSDTVNHGSGRWVQITQQEMEDATF